MSTRPDSGGYHTSEDEHILHKLGYAQELFRGMGGFQNFAISFTIISILAGCLTSYAVGFEHGGPSSIIWGWLLVGLMSTIISLAMAEIASAYPTAGGLYYWASKLGSPGWGWATGWFNLIGQVAVTAAIGYGLATFGAVLLDFWFGYYEQMDDLFGASANASIYLLYAFFMLCACIINIFNIRITAGLNTISAYWHMVGVAFIVAVLIIVPDRHQSLSYVFTETVNNSGFGGGTTSWSSPTFWFVWGLGLLLAQYTITGFDASAHTAEETNKASRMAATGMWTSVVASVIFGWILLLAVTFAIPDTQGALDNIGAVVPWIWQESMGQGWAEALLFICVVAQFFCLTASVTSASRMMFAFSRDRAVPGHQFWTRLNHHRIPYLSVIFMAMFALIVTLPALIGDENDYT
ncbi:MAG: amino acid permease, partial [Gaiellaceae bacterium]